MSFKTLKLELPRYGSIFFAFVDVEIETASVRAVYDLDTGEDVTEREQAAGDLLEAVKSRVC